ncbi:MAG: hypothetical protein SFU83_15080 [Meiothermus sp.]|nr:hypothetical protein [Meiothermus sp.]
MNWSPELIVALVGGLLGLVGVVLGLLNNQSLRQQAGQQVDGLSRLKEDLRLEHDSRFSAASSELRERIAHLDSQYAERMGKIELEMTQLSEYLSARRTIRVTLLAAASRARQAAASLVSSGVNLHDPNTATPESAGALQAIASFFAVLNDVKYRAYLNGSEVNQLGQVSQALSKLFLSLELETETERQRELRLAQEDLGQAVEGLEEMFLPNVQPKKLMMGNA